MKKTYFILLILSLFSNFSKCSENSMIDSSISKLVGMIRMEIIDKCLLNLPNKKRS